ncbi:MAG: flhB [Firmicutes bacterium]|nr:flhB [Bacillota bacterium]
MPPGGEKTEKATPKKRRDERKKGNIFLSKDAIAVVSLFGTFFTLKLLSGGITESIYDYFRLCFQYSQDIPTGQAFTVFRQLFQTGAILFLKCAGPIIAVSIVAAVAATFFQTKMLVSPESLKPKLNRINPIEGFKKLFSLKSIVDALKGILKITILLIIIYRFLENMMINFFNYLNTELGYACSHLFQSSVTMVIQILVAFTILAGFDFYFQWWDYERKLKMSKQEIKEEYKQMEGDPKIKAKIKETQRRMAQSRMMQKVPSADVVIRNPEHVAVALRYKPDIDHAPIVLAMGLDSLALRIVKVAEENHVPTIENVALARTLFAECELDQEIPPALYGMVADVLVYLYRLDAEAKKP